MKPKVLNNGLIFSNGFRFVGSVVVDGGRIERIDTTRTAPGDISDEEYDIIDCQGKMILPGAIDEHVHFRDPGMPENGDIASASRA
ncbi:MAG: dihydroorotase, partial [Muribaculaceae bacterium]|nr:dihydroorotase [Muribaculaceae bacterium]